MIFYCRLPRWKKRTSSSVSWIVWSSKPWRDNWYKQWRYSHLERWVIQWILYSRTLKKLPAEILSCILLKTQFLQTEKNIENLYITNPVKKNVLYPSVRGNVKMRNRIINNLLFVENASILSTHYSLNLLLKLFAVGNVSEKSVRRIENRSK